MSPIKITDVVEEFEFPIGNTWAAAQKSMT